jgi:glucose-1-phosphate adenylyltransferase
MGGTTIRSGAIVKHCIVAENVTIDEGAIIGSMPTGDEKGVATVASGVHIGKNAKIGPNAMVRNNVKDGESHD